MLTIAVIGLAAIYVLMYGTTSIRQHLTTPSDRPAVLGGPAANTGTVYEQGFQRHLEQPTPKPEEADATPMEVLEKDFLEKQM